MPTLGDLLADYPVNSISVHLGESLPVGVPSLGSLVDASFAGYTPAFFAGAFQIQQSNGFSILTGDVSFVCLRNTGFSAACLWLVSTSQGVSVLIAYQPVDPGEASLAQTGTLKLSLSVAIFVIPIGF
jgi:hypothetical protein